VKVCPWPQPYAFEAACAETDSSGHYVLGPLREASYLLEFSTQRSNLRYVDEFYDDAAYPWEADQVALGSAEDRQLSVHLAEGGSIGGIVTDAVTHQPIAGVSTCATDGGGTTRCELSDGTGDYLLNGLPSGEYTVEFEGGNWVNYLREVYDDVAGWEGATKVSVTSPATTLGIDAELAPGAQILGHVTESGTGNPYPNQTVCAHSVSTEHGGCDRTDAAGDYVIRSLPADAYIVAFGIEYMPFVGRIVAQWWQGAASEADATPVVIAPPESREHVDAELVNPFLPTTGPEPSGSEAAPTAVTPPAVQRVMRRKCRTGFHRRKVKGTSRCVRKHRRHRPKRHR
jgi:Carboxypeptidase regulatory-like domain